MLTETLPKPPQSPSGACSPRTTSRSYGLPLLLAAILIGGMFTRSWQFASDRSLWTDEAFLALNLMDRSFAELAAPLDYWQAAPYGFLVLTKIATETMGPSEATLRLAPLIAGLLSLPIFYLLARKVLEPGGAIFALALFALCDPLVYYASECKAYGLDLLLTLLLTWLGIGVFERGGGWRLALFAAVGAVGVWFSYPFVFVCAGVGSLLIAVFWLAKWRTMALAVAGIAVVWAGSFLTNYLLITRAASNNDLLQGFWYRAFMPVLINTPQEVAWYPKTLLAIFADPAGLSPGLGLAMAVLGGFAIVLKRPIVAALIVAPIFITLLASGLHLYPFHLLSDLQYPSPGRLILYIAPALILLVAGGVAWLWRQPSAGARLLGVAAAAVLLIQPVLRAGERIAHPIELQELRPVAQAIAAEARDGDIIYVDEWTVHLFEYYRRRTSLKDTRIAVLKLTSVDDLTTQPGQRIWLVFIHHPEWQHVREREMKCHYHLSKLGEPMSESRAHNAAAFLFRIQ